MARLNDNPKFIQWLDYVELYRSKWGKRWFTDLEVFNFLRQTTPGAELAAVLQSIRLVPGMKKSAEKMQKFLIRASPPAIHSWLDAVWLGAGETPQSVFNILRLGKTPLADRHQFLQWLRFTEKYKAKMGASSYSDRQTLNFLLKGRLTPDVNLAGFSSRLTRLDLKRLGDSLERNLFRRWMATVEPKGIARLVNIEDSITERFKSDPGYKVLEAYTLRFAAEKNGKETLAKVRELLAANNINAALTAAVKAR